MNPDRTRIAARAELERWLQVAGVELVPEVRAVIEQAFVAGYLACSQRIDKLFEVLLDERRGGA